MATISPCAVGSRLVRPRLRPRAMTAPSRTITAPNGKSACRASSMAMRMKRTSSAEVAACAYATAGKTVVDAKPAMKERRLGRMRWQVQSIWQLMVTTSVGQDQTVRWSELLDRNPGIAQAFLLHQRE